MRKLLFIALLAVCVGCAETGPTEVPEAGEWTAQWIGRDYPDDDLAGGEETDGPKRSRSKTRVNARYLRTEFKTEGAVESAYLYICGLGLYEAYLNGVNVAPEDEVLMPTVAHYDRTVYYNAYDVTSLVNRGRNAIGVVLGNGRHTSMRFQKERHYGLPKLLLELRINYRNGSTQTICSDESWKITNAGPIRSNNEFDGEVYDATMEMEGWNEVKFKDSKWEDALVVDAPKGVLKPQPNPNIAVQDHLRPISMKKFGNRYILDMGQNMVGWLALNGVRVAAGDTVVMRFAETMADDSTLYTANLRSAEATDRYIPSEDGFIVWHPHFVYHGFRFVEISGLAADPVADNFDGQVFYDRMKTTGSFECSDSVINAVYHNAFWGIRGNYRGMPTDCPQRDERQGWLGDRSVGCYGESYIFDNHALYLKWLNDIEDSISDKGFIPNVAPPFWEVNRWNISWPSAFVNASDMLYRRFGDDSALKAHYASIKRWLLAMNYRYGEDGIITKDIYGDWCVPPESPEIIYAQDPARVTDGALISTAIYYNICSRMVDYAALVGAPEDASLFRVEADSVKTAFNAKFLNINGYYGNNTATSNILPLYFGMVPDEVKDAVLQNLVDKCNGHVNSGVIGIGYLLRCLTSLGRGDEALRIASASDYPSWGYMASKGATTIWELWNGDTADPSMNSGNHVMLLGDFVIWLYECLGGIIAEEPGYTAIRLAPHFELALDYVNCSFDSVLGPIVSNWEKKGGKLYWHIEVPKGATAKAVLPNGKERTLKAGSHKIKCSL